MFRDQGADCSTKEWNLLIEVTEFEILDTTKFESWKYEHRAPHGHALFFSLDILVTPTNRAIIMLRAFFKVRFRLLLGCVQHLHYCCEEK